MSCTTVQGNHNKGNTLHVSKEEPKNSSTLKISPTEIRTLNIAAAVVAVQAPGGELLNPSRANVRSQNLVTVTSHVEV